MNKEISFSPMVRMLKGFNIAADIVTGTLGPKGRNVYVDDPMQPKFTNDGATIATQVVLKDKLENAGAKILKNTCGQTNDDAGDGTTTTAVLVQAIVKECLARPENPMEIRESLLQAKNKIVSLIKKSANPIDIKDIKKVTLISAENDVLATKISEIINKVGKDAVITVEDSLDFNTTYDLVNGYEANCGFASNAFITEAKRARCVMQDVPVFVTEKKISAIQDISPLFEKFQKNGITSCVIVCDDIENSMLGVFVASKMTGKFNAVVIRASGDALKDIEAAVGAKRVSDETGLSFQNVDLEHLGKVKKIISDANKTLFIPAETSNAKEYATFLEKFVREEPNMYIKQRLQKRIAQLRGGIAVLKIGGQDFEREYLKDKADDAIKASKSALEEGVVEGGGMCLWRISQQIRPKTVGEIILKNALTAPFKKIISNAGKEYADIISDLTLAQQVEDNPIGYDAKLDEYVALIVNGIIDPAKVERCSLENAIANAAQFITMFASITDEPETTK